MFEKGSTIDGKSYFCIMSSLRIPFGRLVLWMMLLALPYSWGWSQEKYYVVDVQDETLTGILSSADDMIYFTTMRGFYSFDGTHIGTLLKDVNCEGMVRDADGDILFTTLRSVGVLSKGGDIRTKEIVPFLHGRRICDLGNGRFAVFCTDGLRIFEKESFAEAAHFECQITAIQTKSLHYDGEKIWMGIDSDLYAFDSSLNLLEKLALPDKLLAYSICSIEGMDGVLVGTQGGLYLAGNGPCRRAPGVIPEGNILFMTPYSGGEVLLGIKDRGLWVVSGSLVGRRILPGENLSFGRCLCYFQESLGNIWLSLDNNGLIYYSQEEEYDLRAIGVENTLTRGYTLTIQEDGSGNVWFLYKGNLYVLGPGETIPSRVFLPGLPAGGDYVTGFLLRSDGSMLVSSLDVLLVYRNSAVESSYRLDSTVQRLQEDSDGSVHISTGTRTYRLSLFGSLEESSSFYAPTSLSRDRNTACRVDSTGTVFLRHGHSPWQAKPVFDDDRRVYTAGFSSDGKIWMTTFEDAIIYAYDPDSESIVKEYPLDSQYYVNNIFSILEDDRGRMWFGTSDGLICIEGEKVSYYNTGRKFDYYATSCLDSYGYLYFAYSNGVTVVHEDKLEHLNGICDEKFHISFDLNNLHGGDIFSDGAVYSDFLNGKVGKDGRIDLKYFENNLSVLCHLVDYKHMQVKYQYRLDSVDEDWIETDDYRIEYSSLPAGRYDLKVKLIGMDEEEARRISFTIHPAPWNTFAARTGYVLLFLCAGFALYSVMKRREREKIKEEVYKTKIEFFTNMSHELRTPLTLVSAPLKDLSADEDFADDSRWKLDIVRRNVDRLVSITEQILDYNNIDNYRKILDLTEGDIAADIRDMVESFRPYAKAEGLSIYQTGKKRLDCYRDKVKIDRVLSNLLSNAVKYSEGKGDIEIVLGTMDGKDARTVYGDDLPDIEYVEIQVKDQGPGIPDDEKKKVFERFRRLEENASGVGGYGIGLNYVKDILDRQHGRVVVQDNVPKGSIFRFVFPRDIKSVLPDSSLEQKVQMPLPVEDLQGQIRQEETWNSFRERILFVDDNTDMREYVGALLSERYDVVCADSAETALHLLSEAYFDLVLSDVMMDGMDGFGLCSEIKSREGASFLPVILLTAKTDSGSWIEGMDVGADSYISKPFDPNYLKAVLENVLQRRKKIRQTIAATTSSSIDSLAAPVEDKVPGDSSEVQPGSETEFVLSAEDLEFLRRLYAILDEHLEEPEMDIAAIITEIGMSRTSFFVRVKSLTGESPIQFITDYKMNKAVEYLKRGDMSIKEIAYSIGYDVRQSFSRAFKKKFGITPTEYQANLGIDNPEDLLVDPIE